VSAPVFSPVQVPIRATIGPDGWRDPASSLSDDHSFGSASGAHRCQAVSTPAAADQGNVIANIRTGGAGWVRNVSDVTTPTVPPPPPRHAQNRSGSSLSETSWTRPSAVTTVAPVSWSQVRPNDRTSTPRPPPRVSPPIPTVAQDPPPMARPAAAS
jgi:hypothetical protein